jgi:hypothetical protein
MGLGNQVVVIVTEPVNRLEVHRVPGPGTGRVARPRRGFM